MFQLLKLFIIALLPFQVFAREEKKLFLHQEDLGKLNEKFRTPEDYFLKLKKEKKIAYDIPYFVRYMRIEYNQPNMSLDEIIKKTTWRDLDEFNKIAKNIPGIDIVSSNRTNGHTD